MSAKNMQISVNEDRAVTKGDSLYSDCLSIECTDKINLIPGSRVQVNLVVRNTSNLGRMASLYANLDPTNGIRIQFAENKLYVAPEGKTVTYVLIEAMLNSKGNCNVTFGVG